MIEDKFGAELLGFQLPASEFPAAFRPSGLQRLASPCLPSALPEFPTLSSSRPGVGWGGVGGWGERAGGAAPPRWCPSFRSGCCPLPTSHTSPTLPHQPVAPLRCSAPAPSWSPPHLPTPTGRSTGGKRAPGPPDQTAPAVLLKVRGTPPRETGAQEVGRGTWGSSWKHHALIPSCLH